MRLGNYPCVIRSGTLAEKVYRDFRHSELAKNPEMKKKEHGSFVPQDDRAFGVQERHRHRFEFNPAYREEMEKSGFIVSATSPDGHLAEIVEIRHHPYMIATQAHPELTSRPSRPHPLFVGFVKAMAENG